MKFMKKDTNVNQDLDEDKKWVKGKTLQVRLGLRAIESAQSGVSDLQYPTKCCERFRGRQSQEGDRPENTAHPDYHPRFDLHRNWAQFPDGLGLFDS